MPALDPERRALAVKLAIEGASIADIGRALGISRQGAADLMRRAGYERVTVWRKIKKRRR